MPDVKAEIESQVQKMQACFESKKLDEILNFYTDDCRILPANAPMIEGKEAVQAFFGMMAQMFEKIGKVENHVVDAVSMGELATSVGTSSAYDKDGKLLDNSKSMTLWKKVDGGWHIHWTTWNSDRPLEGMPAQ